MRVRLVYAFALLTMTAAVGAQPQRPAFVRVTDEVLRGPRPDDWLMFSRTYDAQRFSPLRQITRGNVGRLQQVFKQELGPGTLESIPLVYRGVMYLQMPGAAVRAIDAATGSLLWEYRRTGYSRSKTLSIYDDAIYWATPDGFIVAIDARTGELRWETKTDGLMTSGTLVVDGKVITGRACSPSGEHCYIAAHNAKTGREVWRFHTAARNSDPGGASWGGAPEAGRMAATWGLPGSYDPVRRLLLWGVANPMPNTRMSRHDGQWDAVPTKSPADLYSNSTIALHPDDGVMAWYYQHLPGDDWDLDFTNERTLLRTTIRPDRKFVKWINPDVRPGEVRDVSVMVGEGGGIFVNDRSTGQFLWAHPFPGDVPNFLIADIDGRTGRVHINEDLIFKSPLEHHTVCYWNARSYWPTAYHPDLNALYVPYVENCLDMTSAGPVGEPSEKRAGVRRAGSDPNGWAGLAKIDLSSGKTTFLYKGRAPGQGAVLATAGDLIFWGDLDQKFRAFDAKSGRILWEQTLGGPVQNSTITYAVNGRQYVAVMTGEGNLTGGLIAQAGITPTRRYNALYVFALPAR